MRFLLFLLTRCSSCRAVPSARLVTQARISQNISRYASTARTTARKHAVVQPGRSAPPIDGVARLGRQTPGAFRPELFRFLNKSTPTVLVQCPRPTAYKFGMWSLAACCFGFSVINYYLVLYNPLTELNSFVRGTFYSSCIMVTFIGTFCVYKTTRIISSISAVPYTINHYTGQKGLMLRIEKFPAIELPGRKRPVMELRAHEVFSNGALGIRGVYNSTPFPPTRDEKIAERMYMRQKRRREHQENMSRLYTLPFREAAHFIKRGFRGLGDLLSGDGWVYIRSKSRNGTWRIGRNFEWALDNGHAFDKVVTVETS